MYDKKEIRKELRRSSIAQRNAYTKEERERLSRLAVENLVKTEEFKAANRIMIYEAAKGELILKELTTSPEAEGKELYWPLCISEYDMIALKPQGTDSFQPGYLGIMEPVRELSSEIDPSSIDLVVCPCSAFDEEKHRMGMGKGFYDRFLKKTVNAKVCAIAFEVQKSDEIPCYEWDVPMDFVVTEKTIYR